VVYNLYNNTPGDIRAENNYWGSYIPDTVEAGIFHKVDDPSLGMVDFLPLSPLLTQAPSSGPVSGTALLASVFPNPASEWVQLQFGSSVLQEAGPVRLSLYDYSGRKVYSVSVSSSTPACQVPTSGLPGGLYLLEAIQAGQRQVVVLSVAH